MGITCLLARSAHAQIGTGWSSLTLSGDFIDYEVNDQHSQHNTTSFSAGGMFYINDGSGNETFGLTNSASNRVEHDSNHHYTSGSIQFEGILQMRSGISDQSCVQIFDGTASGPILMLKGYGKNNGTLEKQGGSVVVATNCFATTLRVNLIHDLNANTLTVYINGIQQWTGGGGLGDSFNIKYGLYGSFTAATSTTWSNVKFFTGGSATPPSFSGNYQLKNKASNLVLNNQGSLTNGSPITQWASGSSLNLKWTFIPTSDGYYQIQSVKSGLDANVKGASTANGAGIVQWPFGSGGNDQWQPIQNTDGSYTFYNLHSQKVLEDPGSSMSNTTQMDQWTANGGSNQKWQLIAQ
jgi:hypothetical protein